MTSITITLEKTPKRRDNWSQGDIRIIKEDLAAVGATSYRTVGKQYVVPQCRWTGGRQHPSRLPRVPEEVRALGSPREDQVAHPLDVQSSRRSHLRTAVE